MTSDSRGFTLLELLIGLVLMGFILTLLFSGFRLATTTWTTIETRVGRSSDEQAGLALIRRLLGSIQPLRWRRQIQQPLSFSGQAKRLSTVSLLTESVGLRLIELSIEPQDASTDVDSNDSTRRGLKLVLRENSLDYEADVFDAGVSGVTGHLLIGSIDTATFSYFGAEARGKPATWHKDWTNQERLPTLIRLYINRVDTSPIDLIVETKVTGDRSASSRLVVGPQ